MSNLQNYQYPFSYLLTSSKAWAKYGLSAEAFLALVGIDEDRLHQANATFNGEELVALCVLGSKLNKTGVPDSILVAEQFSFTNIGLLGLAVTAAQDLQQVLDLVTAYYPLIVPGFKMNHFTDGDSLIIEYKLDPDFGEALPFLNEMVMCVMRRFADLFTSKVIAQSVTLAHKPAHPISEYEAYMECPVTFVEGQTQQKKNRLVFKKADLQTKLLHPDNTTLSMIQHQLQQSLEKQNAADTWTKRAKLVWLDKMEEGEYLNQTQMADRLHMSTRTLVRKLSDEGATYRELVNQWRLEKAKQILTETSLPITEIAEKIGFKDESAFFRFFKQSTGQTPRNYRHSS